MNKIIENRGREEKAEEREYSCLLYERLTQATAKLSAAFINVD